MIKPQFILPVKTVPNSPMPAPHICVMCGNPVPPLFYRGQWRIRACGHEAQMLHKHQQEARSIAWNEQSVLRNYGWLESSESSLSALQSMFCKQTFLSFNPHKQPPEKQGEFENALRKCKEYAATLSGNLVLWGTPGVGKTHLLLAICNALREEHHTVARFVVFSEFVNAFQHGSNDEQDRLLRIAKETRLLVLDDVDTVSPSEARERIYFEVFNHRFNAGKPIALSSNLFFPTKTEQGMHPGLVYHIGEKALSRLKTNLVIIGLDGIDQREGR